LLEAHIVSSVISLHRFPLTDHRFSMERHSDLALTHGVYFGVKDLSSFVFEFVNVLKSLI
jgi:hypothetical protein